MSWFRKKDPEVEAKMAEFQDTRNRFLARRARIIKGKNGHWAVLPYVDEKMIGYRRESDRAKAKRHLAFEQREPELQAEYEELVRQADEHNRGLK